MPSRISPARTGGTKCNSTLVLALERPGIGEVFNAPIDVILDRFNIVEPDLVFIRRERLSIVGPKAIEGPPDLVVEILSESTRRTDILIKSGLYARFGVPSYWIADPEIDRLELFRLDGPVYAPAGSFARPAVVSPAEFPGLAIPLDEVFGS